MIIARVTAVKNIKNVAENKDFQLIRGGYKRRSLKLGQQILWFC